MDAEAAGFVSAFVIMVVVSISAGVSDWRKREVSDAHWLILGLSGTALFFAASAAEYGFRWEYLGLAAGSVLIIVDIIRDRVGNVLLFYTAMALLFAVSLYSGWGDPAVEAWATVPACYLIFTGMYVFGVLRGGADAKFLICLSMVFPAYPMFLSFPLIDVPGNIVSRIFVFPVSVLFLAAIIAGAIGLYFVYVNVRNGDICRRMFSGYRMDLEKAVASHVWPTDDVSEGRTVPSGIPEDREAVFSRLRSAGCGRIWVTPMIPFIIPLAAAAVFVVLIGNPLFLI